MSQPHILFKIDSMTLADIPFVTAIEQAAYPRTPPKRDYFYELERNPLAHYFVLRLQNATLPDTIIGAGGCWLMTTELHILTIAIHPKWQGLGLGEWLLLNLLENGLALGAHLATLEVRPSNTTALALYKKYRFQQAGQRPGYYSDTQEDALILTTPVIHSQKYQAMLAQRKNQLLERLAKIQVDKIN